MSWLLLPHLLNINSGFGGVVSPLVCQSAVDAGVPWPKFYLASLVLSATNVAFLVSTFRPTSTEFLRDRQDANARKALCDNEGRCDPEPKNFVEDTENTTVTKTGSSKNSANEKCIVSPLTLLERIV